MTTPKEKIYDEQINPLMAQIIEICKANKIAMICDFALGFEDGDDNQLKCLSAILEDDCEPSPEMLKAYECLRPRNPAFVAFTITTVTPDEKQ